MARGKSKIVGTAMNVLAGVGGAIAANKVKDLIPIENAMIKNAAPVAVGFFLHGMKNNLASAAGTGMMITGAANLISGFIPGLSGIGSVYDEVLSGVYDMGGGSSASDEGVNGWS
jgi:hypothetical protein